MNKYDWRDGLIYIEVVVASVNVKEDGETTVFFEVPDGVEAYARGCDDPHYFSLSLDRVALLTKGTPNGCLKELREGKKLFRFWFDAAGAAVLD